MQRTMLGHMITWSVMCVASAGRPQARHEGLGDLFFSVSSTGAAILAAAETCCK